jgi:hypothetical protein
MPRKHGTRRRGKINQRQLTRRGTPIAKSSAEEIRAAIAKLTAEQQNKLMGEAPASEAAGKLLTDEQVKVELIEKAYNAGPDGLSFDEWVRMKQPTLDNDE